MTKPADRLLYAEPWPDGRTPYWTMGTIWAAAEGKPAVTVAIEDLNILDAVDSMAIVELLLETESLLEEHTGEYIPLADDTIFDASASPLRRWSDWVAFVQRRHAG